MTALRAHAGVVAGLWLVVASMLLAAGGAFAASFARRPVYAAPAALALYGSAEARGRVVNVGSGEEISMLDLLAAIERVLGRTIPTEHRAPRPGAVRRHRADVTLLRSLVDFTPRVGPDEGLERTVEFYLQRFAE